jgi:hypothetical protein
MFPNVTYAEVVHLAAVGWLAGGGGTMVLWEQSGVVCSSFVNPKSKRVNGVSFRRKVCCELVFQLS